MIFRIVRHRALQQWLHGTGRNLTDYSMAFECQWQNRYIEMVNSGHVNIFCSMGDFATNITDMLCDCSCDMVNIDTENANIFHHIESGEDYETYSADALYRYYTRFLLVISEILNDFKDLKDKHFYDTHLKMGNLFAYINHVCKHKSKFFHICNEHSPFFFEDGETLKIDCEKYFKISISDRLNPKKYIKNMPLYLFIPKLEDLIEFIINCYRQLDNYFIKLTDNEYKTTCEQYNQL